MKQALIVNCSAPHYNLGARKLKPLDQVTTDFRQTTLFEAGEMCESGYCML